MYNIFTKYKKFFFILIKWVIVLIACYFIYNKIAESPGLNMEQLKFHLNNAMTKSIWVLLLILLLTDANWIGEIHKWKLLASHIKRISFFEAFEQCLASLTVSIFTPNRLGEYGAKISYFEKSHRKSVALLALLGNLQQLAVTLFFGVIGAIIVLYKYDIRFSDSQLNSMYIVLIIILIGVIVYKKFNLRTRLQKIPKALFRETLGLSLLRYLFFSHQFFLLCTVFDLGLTYTTAMPLIFSMYFLASLIPALTLFDWAIKGSVAVLLFALEDINDLVILSITSIMWLLNFGIPALLGSVFVLNYSTNSEK